MPNYHFHVTDGHARISDAFGSDLSGDDEARGEAVEGARELMAHSVRSGRCRRHWALEVHDATGKLVFSLRFSDALDADNIN